MSEWTFAMTTRSFAFDRATAIGALLMSQPYAGAPPAAAGEAGGSGDGGGERGGDAGGVAGGGGGGGGGRGGVRTAGAGAVALRGDKEKNFQRRARRRPAPLPVVIAQVHSDIT